MKPKIKQSETQIIKRSQINFAPYNPRKKNPDIVNQLKRNLKKVGYLGGIVWNKITGNLVGGHKRIEAMDLIYDYPVNDYDVKVEVVEFDEKTEKEQNIFLNNKRVQGEMDYEMLAVILPDIDIEETGLIEYDIDLIKSFVPEFNMGDNEPIKNDFKDLKKESNEQKEKIKQLKKDIKSKIGNSQSDFYFTVTFENYMQKAEFLESIGINGDSVYIDGKKFVENIQK